MKSMSFALTATKFHQRKKTVTRRLGWIDLKPGTLILGIVQGMGLQKGESQIPLAVIVVTDVRRERLDAITDEDVIREGFTCDANDFIDLFIDAHENCDESTLVTRIEFRFVPGGRSVRPFGNHATMVVCPTQEFSNMDQVYRGHCKDCGCLIYLTYRMHSISKARGKPMKYFCPDCARLYHFFVG